MKASVGMLAIVVVACGLSSAPGAHSGEGMLAALRKLYDVADLADEITQR